MNINVIIGCFVVGGFILLGIAQCISKKLIGDISEIAQNASEDRKSKFAVISGVIYILAACIIAAYLFLVQVKVIPEDYVVCYYGFIFLVFIVSEVVKRKMLKRV